MKHQCPVILKNGKRCSNKRARDKNGKLLKRCTAHHGKKGYSTVGQGASSVSMKSEESRIKVDPSRIVIGTLGASSAPKTGEESDIISLIKNFLEPGDIRPPDKRKKFMDAVLKGVNLVKKEPKNGTPRFSLHLPLEVRRLFKKNIPLHIHLKHEDGKLKANKKYFSPGKRGYDAKDKDRRDGYIIPGHGGYRLYRDVLGTQNDTFSKLDSIPGSTRIHNLVGFGYRPRGDRIAYVHLDFKRLRSQKSVREISTQIREFESLKIVKWPLIFSLYNSGDGDGGELKLSIEDISLEDAKKIAVKNDMELPLGDEEGTVSTLNTQSAAQKKRSYFPGPKKTQAERDQEKLKNKLTWNQMTSEQRKTIGKLEQPGTSYPSFSEWTPLEKDGKVENRFKYGYRVRGFSQPREYPPGYKPPPLTKRIRKSEK